MKTMECAICCREIIRKKAKRRFCIECLERRQRRNLNIKRTPGVDLVKWLRSI